MSSDSHSLLARDYKFFEQARRTALQSDFKTKIGAVAVYGGKVIASAASSEKTSPLQMKYNRFRDFAIDCADCLPKVHAEIALVNKLRKMDGVDFKRVTVYIFRICKSREMGMARCCPGCMKALEDLGVRMIAYSTDRGFAKEWIGVDFKKVGV